MPLQNCIALTRAESELPWVQPTVEKKITAPASDLRPVIRIYGYSKNFF